MKTKLPWILTFVLAIALVVVVVARPTRTAPQTPHQTAQKKILYWVDPMHPAYKSDKPGTAPDCGMDLVPVYEGDVAPGGSQSTVAGYSNVKLTPGRQPL